MGNLYNSIETLNLMLMFSITFISIALYKLSKESSYLSIFLIYSIEVVLTLLIVKYSYISILNQYQYYLIGMVYIAKLVLLLIFKNSINFSNKLKIVIVSTSLLSVLLLKIDTQSSIFTNILTNLIIINYAIVNKIKTHHRSLNVNLKKLRLNKKHISNTTQEINLESRLQNQYKNDIGFLNDKINKSVEEVDTPIFVLDSEKNYIYSNKCFQDMLREDMVSLENTDIDSYIKRKFINSDDLFLSIKKTSTSCEVVINLNTYDNKIFRFTSATDIINGKGVIFCILSDITQSTLIQNQLKESEERYRNLMDILTDGVIIHDMNTINYINNRAIDLFSLDSTINKTWLIDDLNNNLNKRYKQLFIRNINLVQFGKKDKITTKIETEDGKIIEFITTSIILNKKQMLLSLAIDITTLDEAIIELEQSEKTYKMLLQTLPEGIVIIDKKTKNYIYRNKAMIKLLKTIKADNLNKIVNDCIIQKEYNKFKKITVGGEDKCDVSIAIIDMIEDGNYLVVIRNLENAHKVEKMAEKLSEIKAKYKFKTEFLANVTKDIKKPINIIANTNKILDINKDKYQSETINNYTRLVRQNCNRLIRILSNIETIEDIEHGKLKMSYSKVNIVNIVKNIADLSKSYIYEKGLDIRFESNISEKTLFVDKEKIEKVFLNILANAIKFTDVGGNILIRLDVINGEVHISIKDSGVGIPKEKIGVIFEDFEQVDRTLSRGAEGTGIGLALAKKLVDLHDGEIIVDSEIGGGSNFKVILIDNENDDKYNKSAIYDNFVDKEKIDIEFSDIYLNLN